MVIGTQIACATKHMGAKKISTVEARGLDSILQCAYENAQNEVCFVMCNVVEQV